ncbi:MAG: hypothetical protein V4596_04510 [Bdellovibrionota bacterium]
MISRKLLALGYLIIVLQVCISSIHTLAANELCSPLFAEKQAPSLPINVLNNAEITRIRAKGHTVVDKLNGYQVRSGQRKIVVNNPNVILLLGEIASHPRVNIRYTDTFFARGGPFRIGQGERDLYRFFRTLLNRSEATQISSLQQYLARLNSGGAELLMFFSEHLLKDKPIIINSNGNSQTVRFLQLDPKSGYVLIEYLVSKKQERIPGAIFYERMSREERDKLGYNFDVLPESEWFRSIGKKRTGKNGYIYIAELKNDVPVNPYPNKMFEIDQHEIREFSNGVYYNGLPVLTTVTSRFPNFARTFGIKTFQKNNRIIIQYPDVALINETLNALPLHRATPVRLISTSEFESIPLMTFAKSWAREGKSYIAEQGTGHFHDVSLHLTAYLAISREIVLANRSHLDFWIQITEHPLLQKNKSLQDFAQKAIQTWAQDFDNLTGRFLEKIQGADTDAKINSVLENYLTNLNLQNGKDIVLNYYENSSAPWAKILALSREDMEIIQEINTLAKQIPTADIPEHVKKARQQLFLP